MRCAPVDRPAHFEETDRNSARCKLPGGLAPASPPPMTETGSVTIAPGPSVVPWFGAEVVRHRASSAVPCQST